MRQWRKLFRLAREAGVFAADVISGALPKIKRQIVLISYPKKKEYNFEKIVDFDIEF